MRWGETLEEAAIRELEEEAGITADFRFAGLYHKMDYEKNGDFLEDKYFMVMHGTNPQGEIRDAEGHHNEWLSVDELNAKDTVFESIAEITAFAMDDSQTLYQQKYYYEPSEY